MTTMTMTMSKNIYLFIYLSKGGGVGVADEFLFNVNFEESLDKNDHKECSLHTNEKLNRKVVQTEM